jgi:hypothetical protein
MDSARLCGLLMCAALAQASRVRAQTDEIQVYDAAIAPIGAFNLTLHDNYTLRGARVAAYPGAIVADRSLNGVAEWAYGAAPWFEAGLYLPLYSVTRDRAVLYDGLKVRALFVSPDAVKRTFFYGVNFEFSSNTPHWDPRRQTSEIRPIIGAHFGRLDIIFNPIVDNSWTGFSRLEFVPSTRIAFAVNERYKWALEEYDDFGRLGHFLPASRQSHQLFAVVDINTPWVGIEAGVGAGLTSTSDHRILKLILTRDL